MNTVPSLPKILIILISNFCFQVTNLNFNAITLYYQLLSIILYLYNVLLHVNLLSIIFDLQEEMLDTGAIHWVQPTPNSKLADMECYLDGGLSGLNRPQWFPSLVSVTFLAHKRPRLQILIKCRRIVAICYFFVKTQLPIFSSCSQKSLPCRPIHSSFLYIIYHNC